MAEPKLLDDLNRAFDRLAHVDQGWKDWLTSHDLSLFEQYVKIGRHFALDFKLLDRRKEVFTSGRVWAVHQNDGAPVLANHIFHSNESGSYGGHKHIVLIDLIELGECPKESISLLKRPDTINDEVSDPWEGQLYRSILRSGYKSFPLLIEREGHKLGQSGVVSNDLGDHVIQGGPEIMYRVSHTQKEFGWRLNDGIETDAIKARLSIGFIGDAVEIRLQVADGYVLELSDVAFGPVDL